jgi:hypothetical protein
MSEQTQDPRQGFTSASNAESDLLCPGRHLAQRGLAGYDTRESLSGTATHLAFAGVLELEALSSSQRKTVERGRNLESHIVEQWFRSVLCPLEPENIQEQIMKRAHRELRLWAYRNNQKIHSGGIDALWLAGDMRHALVEDLKSLFGDVEDAASNQQLRDYAALVHLNYGCETVSVFINQPNVRWEYDQQKLVHYNEDNLAQSVEAMTRRVMTSQRLDAPRVPGIKQCNFCLACGTDRCPESLQKIRDYAQGNFQTWEFWEPSERSAFIEVTKLTEKLAQNTLDIAKTRIREKPDWAPGWMVTPDMAVRKIEDVHAAAQALHDAYPNHNVFERVAALCKITISDLEKLHAEFYGDQSTAEDRRAEFNVLFADLITKGNRSGSLKKLAL